MLKAVLFDLDDTLIDWSGFGRRWESRERALLQGVYDYVTTNIHPLEDFNQFATNFVDTTRSAWENGRSSLRAPHLGRVLLQALEISGVPVDHLDERRCLEAYNWDAAEGVVVFPDVPPLLQLLRENGIRFGIVTNAYQPMWMRDRELKTFELLDYFPECRFSAADAGYLKPHPAIFEKALQCLGTSPEETVFIGDNPVADIAGAQAVGMLTVLRVTHPTPPMLSGLIVPDHALNSYDELPDVLDNWYPGWR
ncbi:MAG: HAD family hydrolase [Anaerolineae bacterium]|nr:HAD family hydrolase [Anaerolineae bacterium]